MSLPREDRILHQSTKDRDFCHQKTEVKSWLRCLIDSILDKNFNFQEPRFPHLNNGLISIVPALSVGRDKGSLLSFHSEEVTWQVRHS